MRSLAAARWDLSIPIGCTDRARVVGWSGEAAARIVRHQASGVAVGMCRATVTGHDGELTADVAWVIASAHQRRGYARGAAAAMTSRLRQHRVGVIAAHVTPNTGHRSAVAPRPG